MKRYGDLAGSAFEEDPEGMWVKYEDVDRLITGALLHGKIGGLEHALGALVTLRDKGGGLPDLGDWLGRRIDVNRKMLAVFRETGEIPEQAPPMVPNACKVCMREKCSCYEPGCDKCHHEAAPPP